MEEEFDPYIEIVKKRERKKAYIIIISSIASMAGNFYNISFLLQTDINNLNGMLLKEFGKSLAVNFFWFVANVSAILYGIINWYKNKEIPGFELLSQDEKNIAEEQLKEIDAFIDKLPTDLSEDDEDDYESRKYLGRRHGVIKRLKLK